MRNRGATNLIQSGANAKTVTAVMGHEDIRATLNHYVKTTPESLVSAVQVLVDGVTAPLMATNRNSNSVMDHGVQRMFNVGCGGFN